jgi:hypothetical protein
VCRSGNSLTDLGLRRDARVWQSGRFAVELGRTTIESVELHRCQGVRARVFLPGRVERQLHRQGWSFPHGLDVEGNTRMGKQGLPAKAATFSLASQESWNVTRSVAAVPKRDRA